MDVMKNIFPVFQEILTDFKHVFYPHIQHGLVLTKKYSKRYLELLLEIYGELQEAAEAERIPLFFVAAVLLILTFGTYIFFFALLG